ncbi:MAG: dipeptidase E [Chlamydiales bacterium]|jgi:dipeptidase E
MRLLLGSGGFRSDERRERLVEAMAEHFGGIERILFVPFALADHDKYVKVMIERGFAGGYQLEGIHKASDPRAAVEEAEGIYIGGGNTFRLTASLQRLGLLEPIRARVAAGMPYMGVSAGTNVACPTMQTTNDMPITQPASFETLGLVPFQINAHYYNGQTHIETDAGFEAHFGETRDDRIREFHEENELPVVGLWEAGMLHVTDDSIRLSNAPVRLFRRGQDPVDIEPGGELGPLLA